MKAKQIRETKKKYIKKYNPQRKKTLILSSNEKNLCNPQSYYEFDLDVIQKVIWNLLSNFIDE